MLWVEGRVSKMIIIVEVEVHVAVGGEILYRSSSYDNTDRRSGSAHDVIAIGLIRKIATLKPINLGI